MACVSVHMGVYTHVHTCVYIRVCLSVDVCQPVCSMCVCVYILMGTFFIVLYLLICLSLLLNCDLLESKECLILFCILST